MTRATLTVLSAFLLASCAWQDFGPSSPQKLSAEQLRAQQALLQYFQAWRAAPYRNGGLSRRGIDCSGFVYLAYRDLYGVTLPRSTRYQVKRGQRVSERALRVGDLVFFKTGWWRRHVGIYLGDGTFIHVSTSKGVTRSTLTGYWSDHYWKARRVL